MAPAVALLDANVLYPARLRDLFIRLAIAGTFQARWSERILDECFRTLVAHRPDLEREHLDRTRRLMSTAVPDAIIDGYAGLIDRLHLPDPDDRHVLAAAIAGEVDVLVTANLIDFPVTAVTDGLSVVSPDEFVLDLAHRDLDAVLDVVEVQAASLRNPRMSVGELLDGLETVNLARTVSSLRPLLAR